MAARTKILFITYEEHGQANVHITIASTLSKQYPEQVEPHLCSFKRLAARCPQGVLFHQIEGDSQADRLKRNFAHLKPGLRIGKSLPWGHKPTFFSILRAASLWRQALIPWSEAEYLDIVRQTEHIIETVKPDLVVLDPLCCFGSDAVYRLGVRAVTLSPVAWNASARGTMDRENKEWVFKWPAVCSGNPFPLPWYLVPLNFLHFLFVILWMLFLSPGFRRYNKVRIAAGYHPTTPLCRSPFPVICPGTMALDIPGNPSDRVIPCGPIIQSYPPLHETDAELSAWLEKGGKGKTILIVLGSHVRLDDRETSDMASALKDVLQKRQDLQVLWKLMPCEENKRAREQLDQVDEGLQGRLRVVDWLNLDPPAILETGCVGTLVHHGGGNSYHEAIRNGVPHVILAGWADCYDYAQRVRELGIGEWGNERDAPSISYPAVRAALFKVLGSTPTDPVAAAYARNAAAAVPVSRDASCMPHDPDTGEELDVVKAGRKALETGQCEEKGGKVLVDGRDVAAEYILKWAKGNTATIW